MVTSSCCHHRENLQGFTAALAILITEMSQSRQHDDLLALDSIVHFGFSDRRLEKTATFSIPTNSEYKRPVEILESIGPVAYRLRLLEELSSVHDTFHVSNLKKCLADTNLHMSLNEIKIDKTLHFVEELVEIMDREVKSLKRSRILLVKVHWNSKRGPEFTWEREDHMKSKSP
ncbi:hypothetical protein Tco_0646397 [Tanacetum coccineum]